MLLYYITHTGRLASLGLRNASHELLLGLADARVVVVFTAFTSLLWFAALSRRIGPQEIPYRPGGMPPMRR